MVKTYNSAGDDVFKALELLSIVGVLKLNSSIYVCIKQRIIKKYGLKPN